MRVVLPGDADAAEHLNAVLGVGLAHLDARGGRDGGGYRQLRIIGFVGGAGGITCGHGDLLGAQQHLGAHVLDRLEAADRLAELLANLCVFGCGLQCPPGQPGGLGGQHGRGDVLDAPPRHRQDLGGCVGEHHPGQRAGEVGGGQRFDRDTVGGGVDQKELGIRPRKQQHPTRIGAQHVFGGARCPAAVVFQVGGERQPGGSLAGGQCLQQVGPRTRYDQRGNGRGRDRTGNHRGGRFVDHGAQVVDGAARAAGLFGQCHSEDAELRQTRIRSSPRCGVALLDLAGGRYGIGPRSPATDQFTCGKLLVGTGR